MESFIRDARKALSVLDELQQKDSYDTEENVQKFTVTVHGMKSSLHNIGESSLSESAEILEKAGRERKIDLITALTPGFMNAMQILLERIEPKQAEDDDHMNDDAETLLDIFTSIREFCVEYNRKDALDLLASVKHCTKKTRDVLNNIKELIIHSDFEEAQTAAELFLSELPLSA